MRISVVIPSLLRGSLDAAVKAIRAQTIAKRTIFQIIVGVDAGTQIPEGLAEQIDVRFQESAGHSQAAALNAAARLIDGEYLAFLEDDDHWHPEFLETAFAALDHADFAASTTLHVTEQGEVVCIGDFPVPSGWVMRRNVWHEVGEFNEKYRWHIDNEWLGRLAEKRIRRAHLVEATAPITLQAAKQVRPQLVNVMTLGGPEIHLFRHRSPFPLVYRVVHLGSGMARIETQTAPAWQHEQEYVALRQTFGRIPW